jgi:carboxylesterase
MQSIDREIDLARSAGVSHPDNYPFLITPANPNHQGVLLVHGFSSSPREMRALAEHLADLNFTVMGVRLPGHGTTPEDLAGRRLKEWRATLERAYQLLRQKELQVSAVGLSTGALLVLQLSLVHQLGRLVLLSPYLQLKHPLAPLAGVLSHIIPFWHHRIKSSDRPFYYQRRPLKGIAQINRLRWQIKKQLPRISTPTLVLAAEGDQTIRPGTAEQLFERLGSPAKEYYCYGTDVPHVLTAAENPRQQDVFQRTANFLAVPHDQTPGQQE